MLNTYAKYLTYFTLKPRAKAYSSIEAVEFTKDVDLQAAYLWAGYDQGSQFEAGVRVWLHPRAGPGFSGSVMLGGVYLHKHNTGTTYGTAYQNDFYPLQQLRDIQPLQLLAGSFLQVERDIFNIDQLRTFNAWDVELIVVVNEISAPVQLLRRLKRLILVLLGLSEEPIYPTRAAALAATPKPGKVLISSDVETIRKV